MRKPADLEPGKTSPAMSFTGCLHSRNVTNNKYDKLGKNQMLFHASFICGAGYI